MRKGVKEGVEPRPGAPRCKRPTRPKTAAVSGDFASLSTDVTPPWPLTSALARNRSMLLNAAVNRSHTLGGQ